MPKRNRDSQITGVILAFAERLLLAINGPERAFRLRPVYTPKRTSDGIMSVNGGIADIIRVGVDGCF